jgi:hypothetical protein
MMRGFIIVMTAILAITVLKRRLYIHHFISLVVIVGAITEVGWVGINQGNKD